MKNIFFLLIISFVIKLGIGAYAPLFFDEAYYWVWSHHPQLSYYDHPAFVAWIFSLGHQLESFAQAVRWPGILVGHLTTVLWIIFFKAYLSPRQLFWFTCLILTSPLTGPGSLIITPDLPLMFFWAASAVSLQQLFRSEKAIWALVLGACLGLGFVSKYHIVLFPLMGFFWLFYERKSIGQSIRWLGFILASFIVFSYPVWWWNWENNFISFAFQFDHGLGSSVWKPKYTFQYILGQIGIIFPLILYYALNKSARSAPKWLHVFAWGPLIFFLLASFRGRAEANWPISAYPYVLALAVWGEHKFKAFKVMAAIWIGVLIAILIDISNPWMPIKLKTDELRRYSKLVEVSKDFSPLYARTYQMAAKLSWELKRPVYKIHGMSRKDFYDFIDESKPKSKTFFLALKPGEKPPTDWTHDTLKIVRHIPVDSEYEIVEVQRQ